MTMLRANMRLPFTRFIMALLLRGKNVETIYEKLKDFGYHATVPQISEVLKVLSAMARPSAPLSILRNLAKGLWREWPPRKAATVRSAVRT